MTLRLIDTPLAPDDPARAVARAVGLAAQARLRLDRAIPATPPPAVLEELRVAAGAAERLVQHQLALHFQRDSTTGRVVVEVRDVDGNTVTTIPPSAVLAIASGLVMEVLADVLTPAPASSA
jgi:hypothetical protein